MRRGAANRSILPLVMVIGVGAACPADSARSQSRFEDTTSVVVVEIPVQATKDGEPVRDLTVDDFEVFDGRKRQEIVGFDVVDLGASVAPRAQSEAVPLAARRHFLLFFDLSFSEPNSILQARKAANKVVSESLHPSDLVGVATYSSSKGVQLMLGFTSDRRQVQLAVDTLGLPQLVETVRDPLGIVLGPLEGGLRGIAAGAENDRGGASAGLAPDVDAEVLSLLSGLERVSRRAADRNQILALSGSLRELAALMRSVAGRKHVIYLSEGFSSNTLLGLGGTTLEEQARIRQINEASASGQIWEVKSDERFGSTTAQNELTQMLQEFVRADCTIQAVDIGGLRAAGDAQPRAPSEEGLFIMADSTGGEFYRNYNDLGGAMGAMLERTSVTYVLAIQPKNLKPDGKYRRLKVRLKDARRGIRLAHRPGYFAPRPFSELNPSERRLNTAEILIGGEERGQLAASVLAVPFRMTGERAYVPVLIEIDGERLLAGQKGGVLRTEIYAYAMDDKGQVRDFFSQPMGLDTGSAGAALRQSGLKFWGHFDLPAGDYTVRALVRNSDTGAYGLKIEPLYIPSFSAHEATLLPPLFPEPVGKWVMAREQQATQEDVPYPFMWRDQPFIPAARPVVKVSQNAQIYLMGYNLGDGSLAVSGQLFGLGGEPVKGGQVAIEEADRPGTEGVQRWVGAFRPRQVAIGEYLLEVTVTDSQTGQQQTSSIPIRIES